jgi:hypothetical protein
MEGIRTLQTECIQLIESINSKRTTSIRRNRVLFREPLIDIDALVKPEVETETAGTGPAGGAGGTGTITFSDTEIMTVVEETVPVEDYLMECVESSITIESNSRLLLKQRRRYKPKAGLLDDVSGLNTRCASYEDVVVSVDV